MKRSLALCLAALLCCLSLMAGCGAPAYLLEIDGREVWDFTFSEVEAAIRGLNNSYESYVLLQPETPIKKSLYMEAYLPAFGSDDGLGYVVEICVEDFFGNYRYYQARTADVNDVIRCFSRYYKGQALPNLTAWQDVTYDYFDYYDYYDDYDYYDYDYGSAPDQI